MNEVEIFLKHHNACEEGYAWAIGNCKTMQDVWDTAKPEWLIWLATRYGVSNEKLLHKFSCWCVRRVWHLLEDERSRKAVEVKERWIEGNASDEELAEARYAARCASLDEATDAARDSARDSVWDAAWYAAWGEARYAASAAASAVARAVSWDAERDAQAKWIRDNIKPNFNLEQTP